jgi:hypothetical protein
MPSQDETETKVTEQRGIKKKRNQPKRYCSQIEVTEELLREKERPKK